MDKNIIGALIAVPLLIATGSFAGSGCNYTKPELVFDKACLDDACRQQVRQHLPKCQRRYASDLTTTIRYDGGVAKAPHLSLAVMDKLTDCIAASQAGAFDRSSVDFSNFEEISKDVRGDKAKRVGGPCEGSNCSGVFMLPVVGQTTFLYGPA